MKYISIAMKLCTQSRSSFLILKMTFENCRSWVDLVSKLECSSTLFLMLIMNMVLGIDYLDPKLQIWAKLVPTLKVVPIFMKFGTQNKSNMLIMNIILTTVLRAGVIIGQNDYRFRVIIGCKIQLNLRTGLTALTPC